MKYTLLSCIMIMGIQAYLFSKRFRKSNKDNECNDIDVKIDDETIRHQKLVNFNKRLYDMYHELTQEQDTFETKRQENTNIQEVLRSKKYEVENRLQYLEGIKNKIGDRFKDRTTSIQEFKELCSTFVSTHDDIEKVQMEVHQIEIEFEIYLQSWNVELVEHNNKTSNLRKEIETVLKDIASLNESEVQNS